MFDLLPQIIIIISIAGIIFILAKKIPALSSFSDNKKISDINGDKKIKTPDAIQKIWLKIKSFKYSAYFHKSLELSEKVLRKLKILFLKLENIISSWAESIRQQSQKVKIRREGIGIEVKSKNNKEKIHITASDSKTAQEQRELEEFKKAEEEFIQAITRNPRDAENYRKLGELYAQKNNIDDAREAFRQILKINPSDKDAGLRLMSLRVKKIKKFRKAV